MNNDDLKQYIDTRIQSHRHNGIEATQTEALDLFGRSRYILYRIVADTAANAVGTSIGGSLVMPFSGRITQVGATVDTAGVTGTTQIDVNNAGVSIFTTPITIDSAETSSRTAATLPSVLNSGFATGDIFTFDVDTVQGTPALGLTIFFQVQETNDK